MKRSKKLIDQKKCRLRGYTVLTVGEAEKACGIESEDTAAAARDAYCIVCAECPGQDVHCKKLERYNTVLYGKIYETE